MEIGERRVFVLADLYHRGIRSGRSGEMENQDEHLMRCVKWYEGHCKEFGLRGVSFKVLTADPTLATTQRKKDVTYLVDFLRDNNSNLLDFMGFQLRQDIFPHRIFPEHMPLNQAVALVKQGKLFQGKFMNDKSYIKLAGTTKNIILRNNRAMFGDTVIIDFSPRN